MLGAPARLEPALSLPKGALLEVLIFCHPGEFFLRFCHPEEGFSPTRDLRFLTTDNRQLTTFFHAFRENGVVEIESEWTARDRELKMFGGPARTFLCPEPALSLSKG